MESHEMPVVCRFVFRNPVTNLRSDMNGLDLYTVNHFSRLLLHLHIVFIQSSVIGKDRYVLYRQLKEGISKRQE